MADTAAVACEQEVISIKWSGKEYRIPTDTSDTVASIKRKIEAQTHVLQKRQKLLGLLKGGKPASDDTLLTELRLKPGQKIVLMGQPEVEVEKVESMSEAAPQVEDDFDIKTGEQQEVALKDREEVQVTPFHSLCGYTFRCRA
jgi:ubiquitin-like domain-containing CTD phosphatase 1